MTTEQSESAAEENITEDDKDDEEEIPPEEETLPTPSTPTVDTNVAGPSTNRVSLKLLTATIKSDDKSRRNSIESEYEKEHEHELTGEDLAEIKEVFLLFDKDTDGFITTKELGVVLRAMGQNPTEAELLDIITEVDKNDDGLIDFDEFVAVMKGVMKDCNNEDDLKGAFGVFDREGKGYITANDLREIITSVGEKFADEEYEEMIRAADLDGDGQVTLSDFMEMMMTKKPDSL